MGYVIVTVYGHGYLFKDLTLPKDTTNRHSQFDLARFKNCNFERNIFVDCDFSGAYAIDTSYKEATFSAGEYCDVSFERCDFFKAKLSGCIFRSTQFVACNFTRAELLNCTFIDCKFLQCQLGYTGSPTFCNGSIRECSYVPYIPMTCPESGPIIGYKKAVIFDYARGFRGRADVIVKLEIPEDAKRSSALGRKCRCDRAKVLGIYEIIPYMKPIGVRESGAVEAEIRYRIGDKLSDETEAFSKFTSLPGWDGVVSFYRVGQWVYPDEWDNDRFRECSYGIHFFMNAQEAVDY